MLFFVRISFDFINKLNTYILYKTMTDSKHKNTNHAVGRLKIALVLILAAIVIYLFIALFTFNINDAGWSSISSETITKNYAGPVGAYISSFLLAIFGVIAFLIPFLIIDIIRVLLIKPKDEQLSYVMFTIKIIGIVIFILSCTGLAELYLSFANYWVPQRSGGILGYESAKFVVKYLSTVGGSFTLIITLFVGLTLYCGNSWLNLIKEVSKLITKTLAYIATSKPKEKDNINRIDDFEEFKNKSSNLSKDEKASTNISLDNKTDQSVQQSDEDTFREILGHPNNDEELTFIDNKSFEEDSEENIVNGSEHGGFEPVVPEEIESTETKRFDSFEEFVEATPAPVMPKAKTEQPLNNQSVTQNNPVNNAVTTRDNFKKVGLPSIDLLLEPEDKKIVVSQQELNETSSLLEQTLNDFNINAKVVGAYPGPVITRYEIDLARGTKVSKLVGISQDLARALSTTAVRVVEVIPGKPYVGLELPNPTREMVRIKEVLGCPEFLDSKSPTLMGIGVDISGKPTFAELAKMPHLLVAGTTGSGKSVGVNSMIISMLYKCTPEQLKFIMIDPKMLELSIYDGIPHLLTPVVTDMTEAANSLRWCVKEMERRYALMSAAGVRNIALLNDKIEQAEKDGRPLKDTMFIKMNPERAHEAPILTKMPYIVVVADEFADMIMVVGKKVEELIARLAQKARAAGIHIILATQRPSADVVTGLIKANIPTRMSFQVSAKIDSRIMLDQQGAEQLLGMGDMLYLKPGLGAPMRIHGAFVDDNEVHKVVDAWKEYGAPEYIEDILETSEDGENGSSGDNGSSEDPLYNDAVEIVIKSQKASISAVQRKLKIGYNRSARLMEEMEDNGIVSEMNQNGMRDVLINREQ